MMMISSMCCAVVVVAWQIIFSFQFFRESPVEQKPNENFLLTVKDFPRQLQTNTDQCGQKLKFHNNCHVRAVEGRTKSRDDAKVGEIPRNLAASNAS
jgi:hypothetical protein